MADFCSYCECDHYDINLGGALEALKISEHNFYGVFICEGCSAVYLFKEKDGKIGVGFYGGEEIILEESSIKCLYETIENRIEREYKRRKDNLGKAFKQVFDEYLPWLKEDE